MEVPRLPTDQEINAVNDVADEYGVSRDVMHIALAKVHRLIAARVRAEAFRTGQAALRDYADHLAKLGEPEAFVQGHRHAAVILRGVDGAYDLADHDARVRAEERQRVLDELHEMAQLRRPVTLAQDTSTWLASAFGPLTAGSAVPVATPPTCSECGKPRGRDTATTCEHGVVRPHPYPPGSAGRCPGPVATPTEPDEPVERREVIIARWLEEEAAEFDDGDADAVELAIHAHLERRAQDMWAAAEQDGQR